MERQLKYIFEFEDGVKLEFDLNFDKDNNFIQESTETPKDWTKLENYKCDNCPLTCEHCPVAVNLDDVVEKTKNMLSYHRAKVAIATPERSYFKKTDTQDGLLSLFGVIMATSGCPHLDWFKPLARFHLPFSTVEETMFRVLSLQFLGQYFAEGEKASFDIDLIQKHYTEVEIINHSFINRIRAFSKGDADLNAITALDLFAKLFTVEYETNFDSLGEYFKK